MSGYLLAKYNTQTTFTFPVVKRAVVDLAVSADWTPATGDTKVSKDGGNVANTTNNPAAVGGTGSALWSITLTATELSAAEIVVQIVDSATKAVEDQVLRIYTYGNASAKIPVDLSDTVRLGLTALPNVASGSAGAIITAGTGTAQFSVSGGRGNADVVYWNGAALTGKTGSFPEFGIVDSGTAQAATGTTLQLRAAAAFADNELNGAIALIVSATAGAGQARVITGYTGATDTATVDTWATTPTGTIVYIIFAAPPASSTALPAVNMTQIGGDAQSATDLKDFADAGYDPATNKVQGLVLADSLTAVATGGITAGSIAADAIGASELAADAITEIQAGLLTATSANTTRYQKNTASQKVFFTLVDSTDHVTRKTGITVTAQRSLDGAAFGSATGTVTEVGNGVYYLSTSTADINADDVIYRFTGAACDPVELHVVTY